MNLQPDFPADEPMQPAPGCQCAHCRQMRLDAAAAAIVTLVETTKRTFATDAPQGKLDGKLTRQPN